MSDVKNNIKWGPQGSSIGIIEYICQSNDNLDMVPDEDKFKFIDDNTVTDTINLSTVGMASTVILTAQTGRSAAQHTNSNDPFCKIV